VARDPEYDNAFLRELVDGGRLDLHDALASRVAYHEPCYLGRSNGGDYAPRRILELIGCTGSRENPFRCGAGGGRIWIYDQRGQERRSENRTREAVGLGELDFFVVACPKDVAMFEDAIKTSGNAERLELHELTEPMDAAMAPAGDREPAASR
jgi:Fe-S oxidoreductase